MCDPVTLGVATFAQGTMGALGSANQAKARNQAAIRDYKYQLAQREANWYQSLSVWGAKKNKYQNEINENDLAAQRGYSQAQVGLNNMFAQAAQRNEGALIKYLQSHGKMAAAGRTGRSVARISSLELGALERQAGRNLYMLTQSKEAYKANVEGIRQKQIGHRNKLYSQVAFAPVPDLAPPPPVLENQSPGMGIAMAALGGITAFGKAGGKNPFGKGSGMFRGSGGGGNIFSKTFGQELPSFGGGLNSGIDLGLGLDNPVWGQIDTSGIYTGSFDPSGASSWVTTPQFKY